MSGESKGNWPDKLAGGAIRILVAAVAINLAVSFILSVWQPLLIIGGIAVALGLTARALKQRHRGW